MEGKKPTQLEIIPAANLGFNAIALPVAGGPVTGTLQNVAGWQYFSLFFRLDHIGGVTDLTGIKVVLRGFTGGTGAANVYGRAALVDVQDFSCWFSALGADNYVGYTNNDVIFQVNWSKTGGTESVTAHGGNAEMVAGRSWRQVQFIFQGYGVALASSTLTAFLQGY